MDIKLFVPGTIGNFGPGFDVFGAAVEGIGDTYEVTISEQFAFDVEGRDSHLIPRELDTNLFFQAYRLVMIKAECDLKVKVFNRRSLPVGGGLGSSAAASVAGSVAAMEVLKLASTDSYSRMLEREGKSEISLTIESALIAEGKGNIGHADNVLPCLLGGLVFCPVGRLELRCKVLESSAYPVFLYKAQESSSITEQARAGLAKTVSSQGLVLQLGYLSSLAFGLIQENDALIRHGMQDAFAEPCRKVAIQSFDEQRQWLLSQKGLGLCISGSGPTVFGIFAKGTDMEQVLLKFKADFDVPENDICMHTQISKKGVEVFT